MDIAEEAIARLERQKAWGYHAHSETASEPVALAAIALVTAGRTAAAWPLLEWLLARQNADGSVGIDTAQATPGWPTAWATIAWREAQQSGDNDARFAAAVRRGVAWLLGVEGELIEFSGAADHDTQIKGWPWVIGTHAWSEPTAMALIALVQAGYARHERAHEAARLLHNRMLPEGGLNYGNTIVFGQPLRPHVEPTGLALVALAGVPDSTDRTRKSIALLQSQLSAETTTVSLCYGLLGLAAQGEFPEHAGDWLAAAGRRTLARDPSAYKLALLALAAQGPLCPLTRSQREANQT
ncbi:MAG: prenyltransferase/squalene oxidase repeat-containing protein [Pirellulales bacterium]